MTKDIVFHQQPETFEILEAPQETTIQASLLVGQDPDLARRGAAILKDLPHNPDAIAALFESRGIKGVRREAHHCPVASWLIEVGGITVAGVNAVSCYLYGGGGREAEVTVPGWVGEFIRSFDRGQYPQLERAD